MAENTTEVSCFIKYLVFGFNVLFWLLGASCLAAGLWAWSEKQTFEKLDRLADNSLFDPVVILLAVGIIMFLVGFFGCVGALRENTCFLLIYIICVAVILLAQLAIGAYVFFAQATLEAAVSGFLDKAIIKYRDDDDLKDVIDWIQYSWLKCCGTREPQDWQRNQYYNCSSPAELTRCSVPWSCCDSELPAAEQNRQCGKDALDPTPAETKPNIHQIGCLLSGKAWLQANLIPVAATLVSIALLQILGICFAQNVRHDIQAQRNKYREMRRHAGPVST